MTTSSDNQLFQDFLPVSWEEWKARATADLRDIPYDRIRWKTPDGFLLEPRYAADNMHMPPGACTAKSHNGWNNCRRIPVTNCRSANTEALTALSDDATALEFSITSPDLCNKENLELLFESIHFPATAIYLSGSVGDPHRLLENLASITAFSENKGGLLTEVQKNTRELFSAARSLSEFRFLAIDTLPWHERGATPSQEIALALAGVSDLMNRFIAQDVAPERIAAAIEIVMAAGSSHFVELAKPRAFRSLYPFVLKAYGAPENASTVLFARISSKNRSLLDPFTNVLRQTTGAISSILGGYDSLQIDPFDNGISVSLNDAERISANIHLILKEESFLDRVNDPAAGSYYIETLTAELAATAWKQFVEIEAAGGLAEAIKNGMVPDAIARAASSARKNIENRKKNLIGVNRYLWPLTVGQEEQLDALQNAAETARNTSETTSFELLRLKAERHRITTGSIPSVFIWLSGDPALGIRQASFMEDFFRCGGFGIAGTALLDADSSSCATALENNPSIVALCVAEKDPVPAAETICMTIRKQLPGAIIVMAGKPPEGHERLLAAGLDSFVYTSINVLAMLQSYHLKTGIQ
ncbi:MAG: methylmalonyl-CoA mutase subunit beta [Chlorobium sp.]|uniref:methylmalonyl-CoA mutase family protein n=1 Tax=Chlorobium sp. TaxID=1095 RepID=UPI001DE4BFF1|nr:methylmalonyl-CoA mutase family protein [Chlorobium sp.]MBN1279558.1 methylmalonyl-CoA mutase small subunit [Chlorobiaceae bacterium]MCF8216899.1 methylmalonyl-CoA mutase subunit beta [Chlorobium sp.]MCF8271735.1 methylmalonyl-CoA mutase subunit beta [Chlorobium sp.]MCF8288123.1 methylmalonyl-CoA mutase subunit beta [Chlorobium sp.]MCF8291714.1 methylmalonyl-CoA mutase subunit beta [Chlorobium sp.]